MSYQVLARKYRPKNFASLVGQEHVVRALSHALASGRLHHAYLFTGTRGVGKTTLSRILAKSLNCVGPDGSGGITAEPCGACDACTAIDAGRFVDYIEMDAASNRGVDEMASLLEQAVYAPSNARFKVYMIDEVHMLTNHAFNAMLKTLEEPPEHVKFILATTDPQKIPVTVLSRCLQFNLKQMPPAQIIGHLENILGQETIEFELPALRLLAQGAHGSMRDALSLTDQAIAYAAGKVSLDAVQGMLGALDQSYLVRVLDALARQDGADLLAVADEMASRSLSYNGALQDLATLLHRVALAQSVPAAVPEDLPERADIVRLAGLFDAEEIQLFYQIAVHGRNELGLAPDDYAGFSMTLLRMLAFRPAADGGGGGGGGGSGRSVPAPARPAAPASAQPAARPVAAAPAAPTPRPVMAQASDDDGFGDGPGMPAQEAAPAAAAAPAPAPVPAPAPALARTGGLSPAMAALAAARGGALPASARANETKAAAAPAMAAVTAAPAPASLGRIADIVNKNIAAVAERPAPPAPVAKPRPAPSADNAPPPWVTGAPWEDDASWAAQASDEQDVQGLAVAAPPRAMVEEIEAPDAGMAMPEAPAANTAKRAPPPYPHEPKAVPALSWDGDWTVLAQLLPVRGVAQQLALQSELAACETDTHQCVFRLTVPIETWRSQPNLDKLGAALSEHFKQKIVVEAGVGPAYHTASHAIAMERERRQQQAEASVRADPFVQKMLREFNASIVPGSVKPLTN
ncbi:MAG TPA: DNA polymerase III subunit gamma/tau [Burkholderiaceae bacterium]